MRRKLFLLGPTVTLAFLMARAVDARPALRSVQGDDERTLALRADLDHLHIENLQVEVLGRMVTLKGTVESLFEKRKASTLARKTPGVDEVFNDLEVVPVTDTADMEDSIWNELRKDNHYTMYDQLSLSVTGGRVTLTGRLAPGGDPKKIEETVSKVRGVSSIENDIRLLPYSSSDERLREALAISVFDALGMERLGDKNLHIVVENGHVTLFGLVANGEMKRVAENAARRTDGVLSVENLLEVEEPSTATAMLPSR